MKTINIHGYEFPTTCPKECPYLGLPFDQSMLCVRCPIFNCVPGYDNFVIIEPEHYRKDWARDFKEWFDGGCRDYPELSLKKDDE